MSIRFDNVWRSFGATMLHSGRSVSQNGHRSSTVAVRGFSLDIPSNKLVAFLGPSGSGKSTLLSLLTGLLAPDKGEIHLDNQLASGPNRILIPPRQRSIGMVFQTLALWPHMTVRQNLEFVCKGRHSKEETAGQIDKLLTLTDLTGYADSYPPNLSGGEQQRVALVRALIIQPRLFLLDEPLSSLDRNLASKLLPLIKKFHEDFKTTTIYVTHDQLEALSIADLVAIIENGQLRQFDTPEAVYNRPANRFVASFIGDATLLKGELIDSNTVQTVIGRFPCLTNPAIKGKDVWALIRPENPRLDPQGRLKARVTASQFQGQNHLVTVSVSPDITLDVALPAAQALKSEITLTLSNPLWIIPAEPQRSPDYFGAE